MPIVTMTTTISVPAHTIGFERSNEANAAINKTITDWTAAQPGFISQEFIGGELPQNLDRTRTYISKWATFEDYSAFVEARSKLPEQMLRKAYNLEHGIISTNVETIE
jgi:hypothetical protein